MKLVLAITHKHKHVKYQALETVTVNEIIVHANTCKHVCKDTTTTDSQEYYTHTHTHTHTHT